ncbi:hypothetical protein [Tahibacter caeni]|uniref:hypothetical protein n=1 Tax=Tahibacter caeni TaxID=1453545 RepID=UPI002148FAD0|nr:hypothetical protein [Tahibacter caeni]
MHTRISYTDPLLELLDCIEDAVQLLAFDYFGAAGNELRRAEALLAGRLADWRDADAELARLWLRQAAVPAGPAGSRLRRCHSAGALWRARRAVKRHWLNRLGLAWDPYAAPLLAPDDGNGNGDDATPVAAGRTPETNLPRNRRKPFFSVSSRENERKEGGCRRLPLC